jgi:hypothetical protein
MHKIHTIGLSALLLFLAVIPITQKAYAATATHNFGGDGSGCVTGTLHYGFTDAQFNGNLFGYFDSHSNTIWVGDDGNTVWANTGFTYTDETTHKICYLRSSSTFSFYENGTLLGNYALTSAVNATTTVYIGDISAYSGLTFSAWPEATPTPTPTSTPTPTPSPTTIPTIPGIVTAGDCGVLQFLCDYSATIGNQFLYWIVPDTTYFASNISTLRSHFNNTEPFSFVTSAIGSLQALSNQTLTAPVGGWINSMMPQWDFSFDVPVGGIPGTLLCTSNCGTTAATYHVPLVFAPPTEHGCIGMFCNWSDPWLTMVGIGQIFKIALSLIIYVSLMLYFIRQVRRFF